jgi:hypothetical protein
MFDSTSVRGRVPAVGGKAGLSRRLLVDHAAALLAKSTPAQGLSAGFILIGDKASAYTAADGPIALRLPKPHALLADEGYDGDRFHEKSFESFLNLAAARLWLTFLSTQPSKVANPKKPHQATGSTAFRPAVRSIDVAVKPKQKRTL